VSFIPPDCFEEEQPEDMPELPALSESEIDEIERIYEEIRR
jgi:hypothetical protein